MAFTASRPIPGQANTVSIKTAPVKRRSEEHTSELQSQSNLVCRLLLEKKKKHTQFCLCPLAQITPFVDLCMKTTSTSQRRRSLYYSSCAYPDSSPTRLSWLC